MGILNQMIKTSASCGSTIKKMVKTKKKTEKKAAAGTPASQMVKLNGSKLEKAQQAYDALCELSPEREKDASETEKVAIYCNCGEKVHVREGDHKGKNGVVIGKSKTRHNEEYADEDGTVVEKRKREESYRVKLEGDGDVTVTFDKPDTQLEYYESEKDANEKRAEAQTEWQKIAYIEAGPYCSIGDKMKCISGTHEGCMGNVVKIVEDESEEESMESDGTVVSREKRTKNITLKKEDGTQVEVKGTDLKRHYDDDKCDAPIEAKCASDQEDEPGRNPELQSLYEKLARVVSTRILNGDFGAQELIAAFATPKQADSDTVPGKIKHPETQEGVGQYPHGDDKPDGKQEALRVEETDSNIEAIDDAEEDAQKKD